MSPCIVTMRQFDDRPRSRQREFKNVETCTLGPNVVILMSRENKPIAVFPLDQIEGVELPSHDVEPLLVQAPVLVPAFGNRARN